MKEIMRSWTTWLVLILSVSWIVLYPMYRATAAITEATETIAAQLITDQGGWQVLGSFASSGGAANDLGVTQRTLSTARAARNVGANNQDQIIIVENLNAGANAMRFRNIGLAAAGDHVYQVYSGSLGSNDDCAFVKRGTLTFKTGSQASTFATYEYADLLTVTNTSTSSTSWTVANPGDGTELVAECFIDLQGDDTLIIVPTTLDDNSKLLGKYY